MSIDSSTSPPSVAQDEITVPEAPVSLLIPPNPAVLAQQPRGSILLNRNDQTCVSPAKANASIKPSTGASAVLSNVKNAFLFGESGRPRQPAPPAALFNNRNRASSVSSTGSTASTGSYSGMAPQSVPGRRRAPSPSVSFAPLPQVPNLERRRSITLGVAARSNLLKTQGSAAGGMSNTGAPPGPGGPSRKDGRKGYMMMTDEEWEYYKREKANAAQGTGAPEIHHLVRDSGKKLWQKARSLSSSSSKSSSSPKTETNALDTSETGSVASVSSRSSPPTSLSEQTAAPNMPSGRPRLGIFGRSASTGERTADETSEIGSIAEEDEEALEEEEDEEESRVHAIPNRYLDTNGFKPRTESVSTTSDGLSSAGESVYSSNDDEEDEPPVTLPAYLQKDIGAERRHYLHEHEVHHSTSGTATPTGRGFDHERHQYLLDDPLAQSSTDGSSHQNHLHHAHITKKLLAMDLTQSEDDRGYAEGDATPRVQGSPR